jgi:hypothetical protein
MSATAYRQSGQWSPDLLGRLEQLESEAAALYATQSEMVRHQEATRGLGGDLNG